VRLGRECFENLDFVSEALNNNDRSEGCEDDFRAGKVEFDVAWLAVHFAHIDFHFAMDDGINGVAAFDPLRAEHVAQSVLMDAMLCDELEVVIDGCASALVFFLEGFMKEDAAYYNS
jgi:hypothetical protein